MTGVLLSLVEPLPSWPYWFQPQHHASPALSIAQLNECPTEMATPPVSPVTGTGVLLSLVVAVAKLAVVV